MNKAFINFVWKDYPSTDTALEAERLNKINNGLSEVDSRVITLDTSKLDKTTANTMVKDVSFDEATGIFTVTKLNGSQVKIDTKLEKLAVNFKFNSETLKLEITLDDGTKQEIDLSTLISVTEFLDSDTIRVEIVGNKVRMHIINGSVTADMIEPNYLALVTEKSDTAGVAAEKANEYANSAEKWNTRASESASNASTSEANAKTYSESAASSSNNAKQSEENAVAAAQKMGGTIEITDGEAQKENTVVTINPASEDVLLYTATEIDEMVSGLNAEIQALKALLIDGNEVAY